MNNEIIVSEAGECTVVGELAHDLWDCGKGQFPRNRCCANNFYVMRQRWSPTGYDYFDIVAAQSTRSGAMTYMDSDRVLVDVSHTRLEEERICEITHITRV